VKTVVTLLLISLLVGLLFFMLPGSESQPSSITQERVQKKDVQQGSTRLDKPLSGNDGSATSVRHEEPAASAQPDTGEADSILENIIPTTVISGHIVSETKSGLPDMEVILRLVSSRSDNRQMYRTRTNESGEFEFVEIPENHIYRLEVKPTLHYSGHVVEAIEAVQSLPSFRIQLGRLQRLNLEGLITDYSGAPLPDVNLTIQNLSVDYKLTPVSIDSSGFFMLPDFPAGQLKLFTAKPERFQITGVQLSENAGSNLQLRFDRGPYHLQGWVSDQNGIPIDSAKILLEAEFEYAGYQSSSKRESLTDAYGGFEFSNLSEIDHRLTVFAPGKRAYKLNHRFSAYSDQLYVQIED